MVFLEMLIQINDKYKNEFFEIFLVQILFLTDFFLENAFRNFYARAKMEFLGEKRNVGEGY
jgi:hypothetical protein